MAMIMWPDGGGFVYSGRCNRVIRMIKKSLTKATCYRPECTQKFVPNEYYNGCMQIYHSRQCARIDRERVIILKEKYL